MYTPELIELFIYANKMEEERFTPVKGFETRFWISDFGRLVSYDHRKGIINFMKGYIDVCGYYQTQLRMKPVNRKVRIHVLVAEHFCVKKHEGQKWVNHKTGIKLWNYYKDIEWCTEQENVTHAIETGLFNKKGERHPHAKLTEASVIAMRQMHKKSLMTYDRIGKIYGVCRRQARDVINGRNWGWLTESPSTDDMQKCCIPDPS